MLIQRAIPAPTPIHAQTSMGTVALTVSNLQRSLAFYVQILGLQILRRDSNTVTVGVEQRPLFLLMEDPLANMPNPYHTGLYHAAILLPSRADLARLILRLAELGYAMQGYADHLVSEAFYLADPDGNGLELYRDRPRQQWSWREGSVEMANRPINLTEFFASANNTTADWQGMPAETRIGHVHLCVADLEAAVRFYNEIIGFDVVAFMPSAAFVSAGGYHHHLGLNTWQSLGAPPPPPHSLGLAYYTIYVPTPADIETLVHRLTIAKVDFKQDEHTLYCADPSHNQIRVVW